MTVKDLTIGSPAYRVRLDSIDVVHVRLIEAIKVDTRRIELTTPWGSTALVREDATEICCSNETPWYLNIEEAELAQLMLRSEHVEKLKQNMEIAQNTFAEAIQKYAFSEPSTPKEL